MRLFNVFSVTATTLAIFSVACTTGSAPVQDPSALSSAPQSDEQATQQDRSIHTNQDRGEPADLAPPPTPEQERADTPATAALEPQADGPTPLGLSRVAEIMQVRATLVRVIDGDTIAVRFDDGTTETVRYIGIDTPETVAPGRPVQAFGPEASARNKELLVGGEVFLERDISERDRFGRLLRYVYTLNADGALLFVNAALVRAGLATVSTFPPDVKSAETRPFHSPPLPFCHVLSGNVIAFIPSDAILYL